MDLVKISFNSNQYSLFRLGNFVNILKGLNPEIRQVGFSYLREAILGLNLDGCNKEDLEDIIGDIRLLDLNSNEYLKLFTLLIQRVNDTNKDMLKVNYIEPMLDKMIEDDINNIYMSDLCFYCRSTKDIMQIILTNVDRLELSNFQNLVSKIDFTIFTETELNRICSDIWKAIEYRTNIKTNQYKILIALARKCHEVTSYTEIFH